MEVSGLGRLSSVLCAAVLAGTLAGCLPRGGDQEVVVFAAASLADALSEIAEQFEAGGGAALVISYGASQMLAQQIASGAPADVFMAAGDQPVAFLDERGLVDAVGGEVLANKLVVATRRGDGLRLTSMAQLTSAAVGRIAVADPDMAPAGQYARESLTALGLWDELRPKLVFGPDVRATLAYLESGNVDAALVYATDADAAPGVTALDIVPPDSYSTIRYPVAVVGAGGSKAGVAEFVAYLEGTAAAAIFRKHGFETAP